MDRKEYRERMLERHLPALKAAFEERTFNEHDVRTFLRLFPAVEGYPHLSSYAAVVRRRRKDNSFRMLRLCVSIKENGKDYLKHRNPAVPVYSSSYDMELEKFGREFGIRMKPQIRKEINLCLYSLLQFTPVPHCRFCLMQGENSFTLAGLTGKGIQDFSTITGIRNFKQYPGGLISDPVEFRRIDGQLKLVSRSNEIIAEAEDSISPERRNET